MAKKVTQDFVGFLGTAPFGRCLESNLYAPANPPIIHSAVVAAAVTSGLSEPVSVKNRTSTNPITTTADHKANHATNLFSRVIVPSSVLCASRGSTRPAGRRPRMVLHIFVALLAHLGPIASACAEHIVRADESETSADCICTAGGSIRNDPSTI